MNGPRPHYDQAWITDTMTHRDHGTVYNCRSGGIAFAPTNTPQDPSSNDNRYLVAWRDQSREERQLSSAPRYQQQPQLISADILNVSCHYDESFQYDDAQDDIIPTDDNTSYVPPRPWGSSICNVLRPQGSLTVQRRRIERSLFPPSLAPDASLCAVQVILDIVLFEVPSGRILATFPGLGEESLMLYPTPALSILWSPLN